MRTTAALALVVAVVAACLTVGALAREDSQVYGEYGHYDASRTPGIEADEVDRVVLNVTFYTGVPSATLDDAGILAVANALEGAIFGRFTNAGGAPCDVGATQEYISNLDLSHLAMTAVGQGGVIVPVPPNDGMAFWTTLIFTPTTSKYFDIESLPYQLADCIDLNGAISVTTPDAQITGAEVDFGVLSSLDSSRQVAVPDVRGTYYLEVEFDSATNAQAMADWYNGDKADVHRVQAFLQCLAEEDHYDSLGDWELPVYRSDLHIDYAQQLPPPMDSTAALRLFIDYNRPAREHMNLESVLDPELVHDCSWAHFSAMRPDGSPIFPGFENIAVFSGTVANSTDGRYSEAKRQVHRTIGAVEMTQADFDGYNFGESADGMLAHMMSNVLNNARENPALPRVFTPAHITHNGAVYNGTHALIVFEVRISKADAETFGEGDVFGRLSAALADEFASPNALMFQGVGGDDDDGDDDNKDDDPVDSEGFALLDVQVQRTFPAGTLFDSSDASKLVPAFANALRELADGGGTCLLGCTPRTLQECRPDIPDFNVNGRTNSSRYNFTVYPTIRQPGVSPDGRIRLPLFAFGNEQEVRAFACRVRHFNVMYDHLSQAVCAAGSDCLGLRLGKEEFMGEFFMRGPPGGVGRPGATAVFRLFGMPTAGSTDNALWRRAVEDEVQRHMYDAGFVTQVTLTGCVDNAIMPYRAGVTCEVEAATQNNYGGNSTFRALMAPALRMAVREAIAATTDNVGVEWQPDMEGVWRVEYATRARRVSFDSPGVVDSINAQLGGFAIDMGLANPASFRMDACFGWRPAVCTFEFLPDDAVDPGTNLDNLDAVVGMAISAVQAAQEPGLYMSVLQGDDFKFMRGSEPCWECGARGHASSPGEGAAYGATTVRMFFRGPEMNDFNPMEAHPGNARLAMQISAFNTMRNAFDWFRNVNFTDTWVEIKERGRSGNDTLTEVQFKFNFPADAPADKGEQIKRLRRVLNMNATAPFSNITGLALAPKCEPNLFKYVKTEAGTTKELVATDDCWMFFGPLCANYETINSRSDGSGKEYHVIPEADMDWSSSKLQECGCDTQGNGGCDDDNNNRRRLATMNPDAARRHREHLDAVDLMRATFEQVRSARVNMRRL